MSDQDPVDPTRPQQPVGGTPPSEEDPTSVMRPAETERRVETRTEAPRGAPPGPPGGGVSTGVAVAAAIVVGLIGLLVGFLLFDDDDEDDADLADATTTSVVEDGVDTEELQAERDELAGQVEEQQGQIEELEGQVEELEAERDDLQSQLDDAGGEEPATVPAPDVTGGTVDDAASAADENGWELVERPVDAGDEEPGTVVDQSPAPGTDMIEGSVLVVDVAQEPAEG